MEYIYILVGILLIVLAKKIFFAKTKKLELQRRPKMEERYLVNTHEIRLSLYPHSFFCNHLMHDLYKKIVVENHCLNEPFHSSFADVLFFIGENNFWIKSPKTKEIIINTRDDDGENLQGKALHVLDVK